MPDNQPLRDECDATHFWVYCPGCAYAGKIGIPHSYAADVVVCPQCRQVVSVREQDRILWSPAGPSEFLEKQFPHTDWAAISTNDGSPEGGHATQNDEWDAGSEPIPPSPSPQAGANGHVPAWNPVDEGIVALCVATAVIFVAAVCVAALVGAVSR